MHPLSGYRLSVRCPVVDSVAEGPLQAWVGADKCNTFRLETQDQVRTLGRLCPVFRTTEFVSDMTPEERWAAFIA
jgi:hypothetical protein